MPGRNGMGPLGRGPGSGRGWGRCATLQSESDGARQGQRAEPERGRGLGWRRGRGNRGGGPPAWSYVGDDRMASGEMLPVGASPRQAVNALRAEASTLERALEALQSRIRRIEEATANPSAKDPR